MKTMCYQNWYVSVKLLADYHNTNTERAYLQRKQCQGVYHMQLDCLMTLGTKTNMSLFLSPAFCLQVKINTNQATAILTKTDRNHLNT